MERRVLLAFFLSFLVLFAYQSIVVPPPPIDGASDAGPTPAPAAGVSDVPAAPMSPAPPPALSGTEPPPASAASSAPVVGAAAPAEVVVEGQQIRAVFSNRGGVLTSWELTRHLDETTGEPIELVPRALPPEEPRPFSLGFDDAALTARVDAALFRASAERITLTDEAATLSFDFQDTAGLRVRKQFTFDPTVHGFLVQVTISASLDGTPLAPALRWGPALGGVESASSGIAYRTGPRGVIFGRVEEAGVLAEEDVTRPDASDVVARPVYTGQLRFAGVDNHYFLAAAVTQNQPVAVAYRAVPLPPLTPDGDARELMAFEIRLPAGAIDALPFFLGPKNFEDLERAFPSLIQAIEFGWLGWLVVPLHRSLSWIHDYVGNWGWAIIILTFLINVIIFPLRHKSVVSMRKMQELQPEMKAIQERYKHLKTTDPEKQKMNQEIMSLYRDRGVNPASGCLPMLLTMPVLFAFYRLLSLSVEIRGEPFVGWINDLSLHDPLYVTPMIMGASMVLQQKMTPTQADPMQQKIMMLMPVMFTFMFLWAPSGLVLYWLTSNVLGIAQTVVTNRVIGPTKVRTVRPAAERRVKTRTKGKAAKAVKET